MTELSSGQGSNVRSYFRFNYSLCCPSNEGVSRAKKRPFYARLVAFECLNKAVSSCITCVYFSLQIPNLSSEFVSEVTRERKDQSEKIKRSVFLHSVIFIDWMYCDRRGPENRGCLCVCVSVCLSVRASIAKLLGRFQPNLPKWVP